jgi:hypothetical protein
MRVAFSLSGAQAVPAETAALETVYRGALHQGGRAFDVIYRLIPGGVEDFVFFHKRPGVERVSYAVDVSEVAGLRLVENVLEFLDADGAPRLRMRAPELLDARGAPHAAVVSVPDCRFDAPAVQPWDAR